MRISKSAIFLFELMIVILVFTLAAAVCIKIFVGAFSMSTESHDLTMSSINAQTMAEYYKAGNTDIEPLYFDNDRNPTGEAGAVYTVELDEQERAAGSKMREAYVNVYKENLDGAIFSLHVKEYTG